MFSSIGNIILDDIVLPDGRTFMGTLGGGMTHAVMGMRVWTDQVRPISAVGQDFPGNLRAQLEALFDLRGVLRRELRTTRAWQLFEENGHRTEVFRTPIDELVPMAPRADEFPVELLTLQGVHLQGSLYEDNIAWMERLRAAGCQFILWEPFELIFTPDNLDIVLAITRQADGISPNLEEGQRLTGKNDALEILHFFLEHTPLTALRMGGQGSLVGRRGGPVYHVSTAPAPEIVDHTGAGNAYCGGLIVGLLTSGDLIQAAKYAAVSASFALGQIGAVYSMDGVRVQAKQLLNQVGVVQVE